VFPLYAIVDVDVCARAGRPVADVAHDYLAGGARLLQVRAKHLPSGAFLELVDAVAAQARTVGATVLVNDRVDIAATAGLGVHLGQGDLSVADARAVLGPLAIVGLSTHTPAQLAAALRQPVSYVAFGPVFVTATKANLDPVVGLSGLADAVVAARAVGVPLVAIGGITLATAARVREVGAASVAVIADLLAGPESPDARVRRFIQAFERGQPV